MPEEKKVAALTMEEMNTIVKELTLGMPVSIKGRAAREFIVKVAPQLADLASKGRA